MTDICAAAGEPRIPCDEQPEHHITGSGRLTGAMDGLALLQKVIGDGRALADVHHGDHGI